MYPWHNQLLSILKTELINEYFYEMIKIFHEHFPCSIIRLFKYSTFDCTISGLLSYEKPNVHSLSHVHETMETNSYVHEELLKNAVCYFNNNKFQLSMISHSLFSEPILNMILVPFSKNGVVIGFMTCLNVQFDVTDARLNEINEFRTHFINMLQITKNEGDKDFTDKELQVMQYISNGHTTKEISHFLHFSESTIKYFIKNVMNKTNSKNRVEAIAKLFRMRLLQ